MKKYPKYQLRVSDPLMEALKKAGSKKVKAALEKEFLTQPERQSGWRTFTPNVAK